jgi:hypothetical protein
MSHEGFIEIWCCGADSLLVERVVGRRTDPETGKIYHLKYSPPPPDVPLERLMHRSDDTEEKIKVTTTISGYDVDDEQAHEDKVNTGWHAHPQSTTGSDGMYVTLCRDISEASGSSH